MYRFLILLLLLTGCGGGSGGSMRIGVDTTWYPLDFGTQVSYVNGYTEDLLLEMARYSGMQFELINANWDALREGLKEKKYDAILTSMPPYEYNTAKYDFSVNYLDLGPVLIFPVDAKQTNLSKMDGDLVGLITNDPAVLLLEKYPSLIIRNFPSIPDLLNALVNGDIQAAILNQIPAVNYVGDLYAGKLKIVGGPMNNAGLHLVAPKGEIHAFNRNLESLRKKKTVATLLKKWGLSL